MSLPTTAYFYRINPPHQATSDEYDISEGLKQGAPRIAQDSDLCGSTPSFQAPDRSQCRQSGLQVRWLNCPIHEQFLAQ